LIGCCLGNKGLWVQDFADDEVIFINLKQLTVMFRTFAQISHFTERRKIEKIAIPIDFQPDIFIEKFRHRK
jgi:hypothetical protein